MPKDFEDMLMARLDSIDARIQRIDERQMESALKIRAIETRLATYAGTAAFLMTGVALIIERVFFS